MINLVTKDDAVDIAYNAENMSLEQLLEAYASFQKIVNNTPNHIPSKDMDWQHALHAAIGMVTEAAEMLDPFKKELYGKQRPRRKDNTREELGDSFYYFHAMLTAEGFTLKDIIKDNVVKLANRYIEKFEV